MGRGTKAAPRRYSVNAAGKGVGGGRRGGGRRGRGLGGRHGGGKGGRHVLMNAIKSSVN